MKVLVACEYSGTVRDAFVALGHDAMSCDLLPTDRPGNHYQGDIFDVLGRGWDLMIAHPPCTHLAVSGARHFAEKVADGRRGIMSSLWRKPDQIIQPWQFGHGETKATCLWLKGLPKLRPACIVAGREARVHKMPPSPDRWKLRSTTFQGIAEAMADQWSDLETLKLIA
jgi:hypothetical protein